MSLLTRAEIAVKYPVYTEKTLRNWASNNQGPPYYKSGSRVLIDEKEYLAWLQSKRIEPTGTCLGISRRIKNGLVPIHPADASRQGGE